MSRTGSKQGFTLIEIMVTTAVLALVTVFIYEALFVCLDLFTYCNDLLMVLPVVGETMWQAQNSIKRFRSLGEVQTAGSFIKNNKLFTWSLASTTLDEDEGLFRIDLCFSWKEGSRNTQIRRSTYARYQEKK